MTYIFRPLLKRIRLYLKKKMDLRLIRSSDIFDKNWYLEKYPDIAESKVDPVFHYANYGGFEGRDPGPNFSSNGYLNNYEDVRSSGVNPLVHYLKFGSKEGRKIHPHKSDEADFLYSCPVCEDRFSEFLPLSSFYEENKMRYGNTFTFNDVETINPAQYQCPRCGATDRDRLYALFLSRSLNKSPSQKLVNLLDIAPSRSLKLFLLKYPNIKYLSVDRYMGDVDFVLDITDMNAIQTNSFDIFICSHVLEHVNDDKKAMLELFRILKPGGFGILMVPINLKISEIDEDPTVTDIAERWRRFGQDDHVRIYSKKGFLERVEGAGFAVNQYGVELFGEYSFFQYGISQKSVLYIVEKG